MIELFTSATANGQKAAIMIEECAIDYRVHLIDLVAGDHLADSFMTLNPSGKIPVITDSDGPDGRAFTLSQTLAIVLYLAEKTRRLIPADQHERAEAYRYSALIASDVSAAFSGLFIFGVLDPNPGATAYFLSQAERQLRVLERQLGQNRYLAGSNYSFADVLAYPVAATSSKLLPSGLSDYPHLCRWRDEVGVRPAVKRGMAATETA